MASLGWPKLTERLPAGEWGHCQKCGLGGELFTDLRVWQEHDERDRGTPAVVVLCESCSAIIEPHPRLYRRLELDAPMPGVMHLCEGCEHREGYLCRHADLTINGGPGLEIQYPEPTRVHRNYGGGRGDWGWIFNGPAISCAGRSE
jgi:hypothetical protein